MLGVPVIGWIISFLSAAVLAGFQYYQWIKDGGGVKSPWLWAMLFRFVAWMSLLLLLFNPWWIRVKQWVQDPVLLVYTDASMSVSRADQQQWSQALKKIRETKGVKVETYNAADAVVLGGQLQGLDTFHTNMSAVLQHASGIASTTAVAGVVWMTDGINNSGRNPQFEPIMGGVPLLVVGSGNPSPQIDASVEAIQSNEEAFLGNSFAVEISVKSQRMKGQPLRIQLKAGNEVLSQMWTPSNDQDWRRFSFNVQPKSKGVMPLDVVVLGAQGDQNRANNRQTKFVKVVDERKKVALLYGSPHPDVAAIKTALELGGQYLVTVASKSQFSGEADVFVLHGWKMQSKAELQQVNDWVAAGKAIWLFTTESQNLPGLTKIVGLGGELSSPRNWQEVQAHWNENELNWGVDEKESVRWKGFPPVYAPVSKMAIPLGGETVLYQRWSGVNTQLPLMVYWKKESAALAMFYGEGIWRWRIQEKAQNSDAMAFDAWVRRTVGQLATASAQKKSVEIVLTGNQFDVRDRVIARVVCRDRGGMMDDRIERKLTLLNAKGGARPMNLVKSMQGWEANISGLAPGNYQLRAETSAGNAFDEKQISVVDQPAEILNTQANHTLLKQLAAQTDGVFIPLKQVDSLSQLIAQKIVAKPILKAQSQNVHWWDLWGWMLTIAVCLGAEWWIRRYLGKY